MRARYYSPNTTRFISRDTYDGTARNPITQNHYLYGNSNPIYYFDPSGNMSMMQVSNSLYTAMALGSISNLGTNYIFGEINTLSDFTSAIVIGAVEGAFMRSIAYSFSKYLDSAKALPTAFRAFSKFKNSNSVKRAFKNNPKIKQYITVSGPSLPNGKKKPMPMPMPRKLLRNIYVTGQIGGEKGRIFEFQYKIGQNGNPGSGTGFKFRIDYMDYVSYPPKVRPHYHLCYDGTTSCNDHHYLDEL